MKFQRHIGLDIGADSIKAVELEQGPNGKFNLVACASIKTPAFSTPLEKGPILADAIKRLVRDGHFTAKQVVLSLPESQIDTRVIDMPYLEEAELASAIRWQAEQYISLPLNDVMLRHQIISTPEVGTPDAKMQVLLVAAPNNVVASYTDIASRAGLEPVAIEPETFAVSRVLMATDPQTPITLLTNIGAQATSLVILKQGDFVSAQTMATGGTALTRALISDLGLEAIQAENYKRTYGLQTNQLEGKVAVSLRPLIDLIANEMQKALAYYDSHHLGNAERVKRIVLSGGTALLPNLVVYLTSKFTQEIQIIDPFGSISLTENQKQSLADEQPLYATAVGLALKLT